MAIMPPQPQSQPAMFGGGNAQSGAGSIAMGGDPNQQGLMELIKMIASLQGGQGGQGGIGNLMAAKQRPGPAAGPGGGQPMQGP